MSGNSLNTLVRKRVSQSGENAYHPRIYSGGELKVMGRAVVRVRCGGKEEEELVLVVVGGKGPPVYLVRIGWRGCG